MFGDEGTNGAGPSLSAELSCQPSSGLRNRPPPSGIVRVGSRIGRTRNRQASFSQENEVPSPNVVIGAAGAVFAVVGVPEGDGFAARQGVVRRAPNRSVRPAIIRSDVAKCEEGERKPMLAPRREGVDVYARTRWTGAFARLSCAPVSLPSFVASLPLEIVRLRTIHRPDARSEHVSESPDHPNHPFEVLVPAVAVR